MRKDENGRYQRNQIKGGEVTKGKRQKKWKMRKRHKVRGEAKKGRKKEVDEKARQTEGDRCGRTKGM